MASRRGAASFVRMPRARDLVLVALCVVISACGSAAAPGPVSGAAVFRQSCSGCHTLIGNESRRRQGGDLVGYALSRAQLLGLIAEMPVRRPLSSAQLQAVTDYVLRAQRRGATGH